MQERKKRPFENHKFRERFKLFYSSTRDTEYLADLFGVTPNTFRQWLGGYSLPTTERLVTLAEYYDTSTDYLLGLTDDARGRADVNAVQSRLGLSPQAQDALQAMAATMERTGEGCIPLRDMVSAFLASYGVSEMLENIYRKAICNKGIAELELSSDTPEPEQTRQLKLLFQERDLQEYLASKWFSQISEKLASNIAIQR